MNHERQAFSRRLARAMQAKGYSPKPGQLHKLFNSHYTGPSVSFSTVSKWLRGMAIPRQDKLQILARILATEPHVLRYGLETKAGAKSQPPDRTASTAQPDRQSGDALAKLPPDCREAIETLIRAFDCDGQPFP